MTVGSPTWFNSESSRPMNTFASLLLLAASMQEAPLATPAPTKDLVEVAVSGPADMVALMRIVCDPDDHSPVTEGRIRVYATDAEQVALARAGFPTSVLIEDLATFYAERARLDTTLTAGSMGGWRTYQEILDAMDLLASTYPAIVSPRFQIGSSHQGRGIWAMRISDNPSVDEAAEPVAWFDALHHAREPMSAESLLMFAEHLASGYGLDGDITRMVETRNNVFVPCCNPDGYEYNRQTDPYGGGMWRKNRRNNGGGSYGVDTNRNYGWEWGPQWSGSSGDPNSDVYRGPSAFSEPETQAVRDAMALHPPGMAISAHTYSNLWLYSWGYSTVYTSENSAFRWYGQQFAANNGWPYGTVWELLYTANGGANDWHYGQHGTFSFTPEIGSSGDGFWPSPSRIPALYEAVEPAYEMVSMWSGGWAQLDDPSWDEVVGDGDSSIEAGETWAITLAIANGGVVGTTVDLLLTSPDPQVVVQNGSAQVTVGARSTGATSPIQIALGQNATDPSYTLDLAVTFDGLTTHEPVVIRTGSRRLIAFDDADGSSDMGWTTTTTAPHYGFERAVPERTTSSGQTVQPGSDNSPSGTRCWVTGASAGSSVGENDVDGTTRLLSPVFSADGFGSLELEYARWFANLPGSGQDDIMLVELSNDGGLSWTTLEQATNANRWTTVTHNLELALPLTRTMRLRFTVSDDPNNDLTEGCVDDVALYSYAAHPTLGIWGEVAPGSSASLFLDGEAGLSYAIGWSFQKDGAGSIVPGYAGLFHLSAPFTWFLNGTLGSDGRAVASASIPNQPGLSGRVIHLQAVIDYLPGPQAAFSNLLSIVVE